MNIEQLIEESRELEETARNIQNGQTIGLSEKEVNDFIDLYRDWYARCLAILTDDLKVRYRAEYEGGMITFKIKKFLEAPTQPNTLLRSNNTSTLPVSYFLHPYERTFRIPLLAQRQILLEASKQQGAFISHASAIAKIELIARRFSFVTRQLQQRHGNRPTLQISDEYDVQDLFASLLKLFFDDVRPEETTPSYAGGSSRIDYLIKNEQVVVELKKTRANLKAKDVRDQLIIDINTYRSHPDCKSLVAFVYDPDLYIDNPMALESDLSRVTDGIYVKVIVTQR